MISYNEFAAVPENGIICHEEGSLLRVYFDIEAHVPVVSENEPENLHDSSEATQYVCKNVDVNGRTYADIVSAIVNDKYSADDVQALQANYIEAKDPDSQIESTKREEYLSEYVAFQAWRKRAKEVASAVVGLLNS